MNGTLVAVPGGWELVLIVLVIVMLFGAKKLPELARGTGRALRIFKAETKGLIDDDDESAKDGEGRTGEPKKLDAGASGSTTVSAEQVVPSTDAERDRA